ncbi:CarD family transcriptional regulator [Clostridium tertium]|jgi:CarD family transcriptional regulator|uniref:CarD family transcriptional regulator n=1 Tax=Clostridium TaxID=1485 RepID=UPI00115B7783|nr:MULTISPECIES: CarD family transcriptional regulator [Clostridium]MDB1922152.1 CarD family transcriptional regulator [Clostridium tertium]MDB1927516.1 CarD family transcriptional regulator [Clostridium tertium]MDB1930871.1 CarD family transcriptional regulator [Clostridium tertium]MDB1933053.1 CarD family transcriptional regulator [Clostridium tertium]MDB1938861.1 CarD family transcriptional regulator [Clostridium tertium]
MFKINDYVVYGSNGVCKVTDIEQVTLRNEELEYYILSPVYNEKMTIKTPVNNQKILMRELMTKAEIVNLLKEISKNETVEIEDSRRRVEEYKAIIKRGNAEELIKVINSIKLEKDEKNSIGKKLNKTDEDIMISASKQLYQEMAIVLDIDVDEVQDYIKNNI